jgi:hypothetical protein
VRVLNKPFELPSLRLRCHPLCGSLRGVYKLTKNFFAEHKSGCDRQISKIVTTDDRLLAKRGELLKNPFQSKLGLLLLTLGWFIAVWDSYPWQAMGVSLLIAWLVCDRLHQFKSVIDLTKLFFWGLQILWLGTRLVPYEWWGGFQGWVKISAFFQTNSYPAIIGVVLFPYLVLALAFAAIYRHHHQSALASGSENLALGFGFFLSILSFVSPFTRFLNLTLSASL